MIKIRLRRMGSKKRPFYRLVVAPSVAPRGGRFVETIGTYDPLTDPPTIKLKHERALYWLTVGAQPTETAKRILDKEGVTEHHETTKAANKKEPKEKKEPKANKEPKAKVKA